MIEVELCEDLLDEIIARLPPKFIFQFRCVSKSWCSRIDSSDFIRKQAIHSAAQARQIVDVAYQVHIEEEVYKILHELKLEGPLLELDSLKFPGGCNVFDSCIPNYDLFEEFSVVFGFGYDPIADDYNVIGLSTYGTSLQTLFLYSTKKNAWSEIDLFEAYPPFKVPSSSGCFVDGAMHWVVKNDSTNTNDSYILTFHLSSRAFGAIPLPTWSKPFKVSFNDVKGGLRVYNIDQELEVPKVYNPFSGVSRTPMRSSNSCVKFQLDSYVETLALLDNENCSTSE
ncbi:putative F-box protein At3g16210 [Rutidosis leptorrhynchoides]|uniref:putative F-box protein At3g16210 n=1 Tax=Rutidosis leptorrhynchoides TaxID=125765 RepID=UPI003A9912B3